jgi:hypothetical protein
VCNNASGGRIVVMLSSSFLLAKFTPTGAEILEGKDFRKAKEAASVAKVFLAAEIIRLMEEGRVKNSQILIKRSDIEAYGTDVLADIVKNNNVVNLDVLTLIGLMIKYSCNSSASILSKRILPKRRDLDKVAKDVWELKDSKLAAKDGRRLNKFSLGDLLLIFRKIYGEEGKLWNFLKEKLRTSRNIYYLFDQKEIEILGCKSGTKKVGPKYFINDCGVFRYNDEVYFMGAMVSDRSISRAVLGIRKIGEDLLLKLDSGRRS